MRKLILTDVHDIISNDPTTELVDGANGGATNAFYREENADSGSLPGTGAGPTVPIGHSKWRSSATAYHDALTNPDECARGLCALAHCAGILLHELLHQCAYDLLDDPRDEENPTSDDFRCWAIQNMAASAFGWALSQRYPELQGLACCPANTAEWFMHSGEIGQFNPPYPWDEGAPC